MNTTPCVICGVPGLQRPCCSQSMCNACYYTARKECPKCAGATHSDTTPTTEPPSRTERVLTYSYVWTLAVVPFFGIGAFAASELVRARTALGFRCATHDEPQLQCVQGNAVEQMALNWPTCSNSTSNVGCTCGLACPVSTCLVETTQWGAGWDFVATGPGGEPSPSGARSYEFGMPDTFFPLEYVWQDNFDDGVDPGLFEPPQGFVQSSACGAIAGTSTLRFRGLDPRVLQTKPQNLEFGGVVEFWLIYGRGERLGCGSMEAGLVRLDASTNGGVNWTEIVTFPRATFRQPEFTHARVYLPKEVWSTSTILRWHQPKYFEEFDVWAIDSIRLGRKAPPSWGVSSSWEKQAAQRRKAMVASMCCASCPECPSPDTFFESFDIADALNKSSSTTIPVCGSGDQGNAYINSVRRAGAVVAVLLLTGILSGVWLLVAAASIAYTCLHKTAARVSHSINSSSVLRKTKTERQLEHMRNKRKRRLLRRQRLEAELDRRRNLQKANVNLDELLLRDIDEAPGAARINPQTNNPDSPPPAPLVRDPTPPPVAAGVIFDESDLKDSPRSKDEAKSDEASPPPPQNNVEHDDDTIPANDSTSHFPKQGSGWVEGPLGEVSVDALREKEEYRNKYALADAWAEEARHLDVLDADGEVYYELRAALNPDTAPPIAHVDVPDTSHAMRRLRNVQKLLRAGALSKSSPKEPLFSESKADGIDDPKLGPISDYNEPSQPPPKNTSSPEEPGEQSRGIPVGSLHGSDLSLADLSDEDWNDAMEVGIEGLVRVKDEEEGVEGDQNAKIQRRLRRAEERVRHEFQLDADPLADSDEEEQENGDDNGGRRVKVPNTKLAELLVGSAERRYGMPGAGKNAWMDRLSDGSRAFTFRGETNVCLVFATFVAALLLVLTGLLALGIDRAEHLATGSQDSVVRIRARLVFFDVESTEGGLLVAALAADLLTVWRLVAGPLAFFGLQPSRIHVLLPSIRTHDDYLDWLRRSVLLIRGGGSLGGDLKYPLRSVRDVHFLPGGSVIGMQALLVLGCTPLASFGLLAATNSLVATGASGERSSDVAEEEAKNGILYAVSVMCAILALVRAFSGPEGLLWIVLASRQIISLCGWVGDQTKERVIASTCGFRCRLSACQALLAFGPVLFVLWVVYALTVAAGDTLAANAAANTFEVDAPVFFVVGFLLLLVFGGATGCFHNLPVTARPLVRSLRPGIRVVLDAPRRSELFERMPCPPCEGRVITHPTRFDAAIDAIARTFGLMPRSAEAFRLDPRPSHQASVFVPGISDSPALVRILKSNDLLAHFVAHQRRLTAIEGDSDDDSALDEDEDEGSLGIWALEVEENEPPSKEQAPSSISCFGFSKPTKSQIVPVDPNTDPQPTNDDDATNSSLDEDNDEYGMDSARRAHIARRDMTAHQRGVAMIGATALQNN